MGPIWPHKNENTMKKMPFYKKKWFVGTKIQKDLLIYILCFGLLSQLALVGYIMAKDDLMNESYIQHVSALINIVFCGYIIYGFWLSNRIAGPLARFKKHMDEVAEGKVDSEIIFRKNDYGTELAESFNAVVKNRIDKS
jgi:methyl-accepting chemotaxis protein